MKIHQKAPAYFLIVAALSPLFANAQEQNYKCTTEFGQTVPIRIAISEKGRKPVVTELNPEVEKLTSFQTLVKKREFKLEAKTVVLETRYATREGPTFTFKMNCKKGKCEGALPAPKLRLDTEVFDKRPESRSGWAELQFTNRNNLNLLIRLHRETPALSGSGELKILNEQERYMIDVGIDEQVELAKGLITRLAALEIKVDCNRTPAVEKP